MHNGWGLFMISVIVHNGWGTVHRIHYCMEGRVLFMDPFHNGWVLFTGSVTVWKERVLFMGSVTVMTTVTCEREAGVQESKSKG
jgi:hypothetical protein